MMGHKHRSLLILLICGLGIMSQAYARDVMGDYVIADRRFAEFTPKGFRVGRFDMTSSLSGGYSHSSNVFRTEDNELSDSVISYGANIAGATSYSNTDIDFDAQIRALDYSKVDQFDQVNYQARLKADIDLTKNADMVIEGRRLRTHQTFFDNPIPSDVYDPAAVDENRFLTELILKPANTQVTLSARYRGLTYDDTTLRSTNNTLVQSDRDRHIYSGSVRVSRAGYSGSDGGRFIPFIGFNLTRSAYERRSYDNTTNDFTGRDQDRTIYTAFSGIEFQPTGKLRGEASIGFGVDRPDDKSREDNKNLTVDIDLTYLYTPLTNFVFNAKRFFGTDSGNSEVVLETELNAKVIHELTRQWILNAEVGYSEREFSNNITDNTWNFGTGVNYKMNDRYSVQGDLKFLSRETDGSRGNFDETRAVVSVKRSF